MSKISNLASFRIVSSVYEQQQQQTHQIAPSSLLKPEPMDSSPLLVSTVPNYFEMLKNLAKIDSSKSLYKITQLNIPYAPSLLGSDKSWFYSQPFCYFYSNIHFFREICMNFGNSSRKNIRKINRIYLSFSVSFWLCVNHTVRNEIAYYFSARQ